MPRATAKPQTLIKGHLDTWFLLHGIPLTLSTAPNVSLIKGVLGLILCLPETKYVSLSHTTVQSCEGVYRSTGYELSPLRLDVEASLDQPQLHLEEDQETGLHFSYPASVLLHGEHVRYASTLFYAYVYY